MRPTPAIHLTLLTLLLAGVSAANAADGVLEISQACVPAGCFGGDAPGFPVTIDGSAGHSYALTSDLTVPDEHTTAIEISASAISLDLNGFSVRGITTCNYFPYADCGPVGTGHGIAANAGIVHVRNGAVVGLGGYGIDLSFDSVVEEVRALNNGLGGIRLGPGSAARGVTANANGGHGVSALFRAGVHSAVATNNNQNGIWVGDGSIVRDSVVHSNGQNGIQCSGDCLATANEITANGGAGLVGPASCSSGTVVAYGGSLINRNAGGTVQGCALQVGSNVCGLSTNCP